MNHSISNQGMTTPLWPFPKAILILIGLLTVSISTNSQTVTNKIWQDITESSIRVESQDRKIIPQVYRTVHLNRKELTGILNAAPEEFTAASKIISTILQVPMPDGTFQNFSIVKSTIMEEGLAEKFPEIKTYSGYGIDDATATIFLDQTYTGFHLMILSENGNVFIDPYSSTDQENYIVYYKKDFIPSAEKLLYGSCFADDEWNEKLLQEELRLTPQLFAPSGSELRTYRLAIATTGEYTTFHGGTVSGALSAIATTMNRVNGIYITEVAIRMILIANNDTLIYTNGGSDPYTNGDASLMINENQSTITTIIGSGNFDIGHVFGTNSGGLAEPGPCDNATKARGITGSGNPIGDPFDIDYVAHEMGHQFSARHTFNGDDGECLTNRVETSAYEPGSGTTVMAYAGICGTSDLQPNSDAFFHTRSFDQIVSYSTTGTGNGCAVVTTTGNNPPTANAGTGGFTIPKSTPFTLNGSGSDPDGQPLTYCWEEYDLGPQGAPNSPVGDAPIFRSFNPATVTSRTFPKLSDILSNTQTKGEILPSYGRNLTFRLTVRDNQTAGGGVNYDDVDFDVTNAAGPFLVTAPNTNVIWCVGTSETITWNVANTTAAPVSTANVNILLSVDGGNTFSIILASNTPNDGSQVITVPNNVALNLARVKVAAVGNIYFDLSNTNFTINAGPAITLQPVSQSKQWGDTVIFTAAATGTPTPSSQWQISTDGGGSFTAIAGETGNSLTLSCLTLSENNNRYRVRYTNVCNSINSAAAILTVTPRAATALFTITPNPRQYSDLVTFHVVLENGAACSQQAATDVSFYIGTQFFGTVALTINGDDLEATLSNQALLEPTPIGTLPTGQMAPGVISATADFSGTNSNFVVTDAIIPMTIEKEDARAYYTGACFASTLGATNCNSVVTLSATIKDISAVAGDPDYDATAGNILYATLSFVNRSTNTIIASNVPIGLVNPLDPTIAVGTYNWNVCITGNSQTFDIGIIIDGYYTRNSSFDNVLVTVSKPVGNFVTGGGYIVLANSAGLVAGDAGSKSNFGFNTKFNQQGSNLQGTVNVLIRRTEIDGIHVYKIKSNVFTSLGIQKESWGGKSTINSKAIVQDVTDPNNIISIFGNGSMQIKFTDRGNPGTADSIAITIWNKQGGLWYSSNWNSTTTLEQGLAGGNLKISSNNSYAIREGAPLVSNTKGINAFPNPTSGVFQLLLEPRAGVKHELTVYNVFGKEVLTAELFDADGTGQFTIYLTDYAAGIYLLRITTGTEVNFVKMAVEK